MMCCDQCNREISKRDDVLLVSRSGPSGIALEVEMCSYACVAEWAVRRCDEERDAMSEIPQG